MPKHTITNDLMKALENDGENPTGSYALVAEVGKKGEGKSISYLKGTDAGVTSMIAALLQSDRKLRKDVKTMMRFQ